MMMTANSGGYAFLTPDKRGGCQKAKPFRDDVSESDTPSTLDGDESAISDLTDDCLMSRRRCTSPAFRSTSMAFHDCETRPLRDEFSLGSPAPYPVAVSVGSPSSQCMEDHMDHRPYRESQIYRPEMGISQRIHEVVRGSKSNAHRSVENRSNAAEAEAYRDSTVRRTMTAKKERRAAFDSLMGHKRSGLNCSEWPRRHSAPTSPAFSSLMGRQVPEFMLDDTRENRVALPARPFSAPESPMLRSFKAENDVAPHLLLDALTDLASNSPSIHDLPTRPKTKSDVAVRVRKDKRSVRFGEVQVRSYERILGDNPSCMGGPSVSIGWNYVKDWVLNVSVDHFEEERAGTRSRFVPILSRGEREGMLMDLGYTQAELASATRETKRIKNRRRQTVTNLYAARAEEAAEGTKRWVKKAFKFGEKNKSPKRSKSKEQEKKKVF